MIDSVEVTTAPVASRRWLLVAALGGGAAMTAATLLWHASGFLFNAISARVLGPVGFANVAALMSLVYVASPFYLALQTVASRAATGLSVGGREDAIRPLLRSGYRRFGAAGVVLLAVWLVASQTIAGLLRITSSGPVAILGLVLLLSIFSHLQKGVIQGLRRYTRFGVAAAVEAAAKILGVSLLFVWGWRDESAAITALAVSTGVAVIVNERLLRFLPERSLSSIASSYPLGYSMLALTTLVALSMLFSADIVAANRYLPGAAGGRYVAASLVGKIAFFVPSAITWYVFPLISDRFDRGLDTRRTYLLAVGAIVTVAAIPVIIHLVRPSLLVAILFGQGYVAASRFVPWLTAAFVCYGILHLSAMYLVAQGRAIAPVILGIATVAQLAAFFMRHGTIEEFVAIEMTVLGLAAGVLVAVAGVGVASKIRRVTL